MKIHPLMACAALLSCAVLAACSPKYNWRDYASPDASYRAMFPAKPASFTRSIDLDGMPVTMTMTAAEIDGATFAVGAAEAPDVARARAAVDAMRLALIRNIGAPATAAKSGANTPAPDADAVVDVDATGQANGRPMRLVGRFEARGKRFYQVIVMGQPKAMPAEQLDQFLSSFKPL